MQKRNLLIVLTITLLTVLPACTAPELATVDVTREVEVPQTVEVTRIVEQVHEVTREVEVTIEVEVTREVQATREMETEGEAEATVAAMPPEPGEQLVGPGIFLVNTDIAPGTYQIEGEDLGYTRRLSCLDGTTDCVIAMIDMEGGGYVTVEESDKALKVGAYSGQAIVTQVDMAAEVEPKVDEPGDQIIGPGIFLVGIDITPGTYQIEGEDLGYTRRLSCLDGTTHCVIAMIDMEGGGYVTVEESDKALKVGAYSGQAIVTKVD